MSPADRPASNTINKFNLAIIIKQIKKHINIFQTEYINWGRLEDGGRQKTERLFRPNQNPFGRKLCVYECSLKNGKMWPDVAASPLAEERPLQYLKRMLQVFGL